MIVIICAFIVCHVRLLYFREHKKVYNIIIIAVLPAVKVKEYTHLKFRLSYCVLCFKTSYSYCKIVFTVMLQQYVGTTTLLGAQ